MKLIKPASCPATLSEVKLSHLYTLFDEVGIIQHAAFGIPDRNYGYSADDVGRALVVLCNLYEVRPQEDILRLMRICLAFLRQAQTEDGHYHNFMSYDRRFLDVHGSEDTLGRVIWGLGSLVHHSPAAGMAQLARTMVDKSLGVISGMEAPRGKAYAIAGLSLVARSVQSKKENVYEQAVHDLARDLVKAYKRNRSEGWEWFEDTVTYGNARISESLLDAYEVTGEEDFRRVGLRTLEFLVEIQWNGTYFDLVGNQGWFPRNGHRARFSQQPIDAGYLVEASAKAYEITQEEQYLHFAEKALDWFFGLNRLGVPVYDPETGAVADGLDPQGLSANAGAESIICFLLGLQSLLRTQAVEKAG